MENIYDYNKYKNVVSYYMTSKTISNCFLMEKKAKELINEKNYWLCNGKIIYFCLRGNNHSIGCIILLMI